MIRTSKILLLSVLSILIVEEVKLMKKVFLFMMLIAALFMMGNTAMAYPLLQLDIGGGVYDSVEETILSGVTEFELYALLDTSNMDNKLKDFGDPTYCLVASVDPAAMDNGSFQIDGTPVAVTGGMVPTAGPNPVLSHPKLNHGELGSYGYLYQFSFDPNNTAMAYNTQDNPGGFVADPSGTFLYEDFSVDISGLDPFIPVHFDLLVYDADDILGGALRGVRSGSSGIDMITAPFSHDATGVPEPSSMLLLGSGLVGLAAFARKKVRKG